MRTKVILIAAALTAGGAVAVAQTQHGGHGDGMDHAAHGQGQAMQTAALSEPGQGAFAALSEVVRLLEADPGTDWSRVDLTGLRTHLVDMDRLVSDAIVTEKVHVDGITASARGDAQTLATLRRMVPAHAAQLAKDDRWTVEAVEISDAVELRVTSDDPAVAARVKGLGFFGLMASQDHHRDHHLMIARGQNAHGH